MATRKEIAENQKILYDDAVANNMFQAAVPSFEEFQKRLEGQGYQKMVYDNYRKHNVSGKGFNSIEDFRGSFGGSFYADENKQKMSGYAQHISAQAKQTVNNAGRYNNLKQRKQKQKNDFGRITVGSNTTPYGGNADDVVKDEFAYNPETENTGTYVTSDNSESGSLLEAQERQNILDKQNQVYQEAVDTGEIPSVFGVRDKNGNYDLQENIGKDGTYVTEEGKQNQLNAQLNTAYAERDRLNELARKRMEEIDNRENQGFTDFMLQAAAASSAGGGLVGEAETSTRKYEQDDTYRNIMTALRQNKATITTLEDVKNDQTNGFWHSLGTTAANGYTFTDGMGVFNDVTSLNQAQQHLDDINRKRKSGEKLTPKEELLESVLKNTAINNIVQSQYGGNYGAWARAGEMTAHSLDFMKEIMEFPAAGSIAKSTATKIAQFGAKTLAKKTGEMAVKSMAKATARGVLKATGILVGSHVAGAAVSNTTGIGSTMGLMGQLQTGSVGYDKDGNYQFDEGMKLLPAFIEAERTQIRENGSEMFGEFIPGGKTFVKGLEKIGFSKLASHLTAIGNKQWYKQYYGLLQAGGYNGLLGEGLEEYEGSLYDAMTGHASDAWNDMKDPKTHIDIWLGVGTMSVLLGAVPMIIQGRQTYGYFKYKHQVDTADKLASAAFGDQEKWNELKEQIDSTPNENISQLLVDIDRQSDKYTKEQQDAAALYVGALTKQRVYNIAEINNANETDDADSDGSKRAANEEKGNAYAEGHEAEGAETHNIQVEHENNRKTLAELLGVTEQQLSAMDDEELESLAGQNDALDVALYDYQMSNAKYQGVIDSANDKVDLAAQQASMDVDMRTDKTRGAVRNATIKATKGAENYGVYILSGNLATHEDGTIDISGSDQMILYYDPTTGKVDHADASRFAALGKETPADIAKEKAVSEAKGKAIREAAGIIDGKVGVGSQFTITDEQGNEHTYEVLADNGDGTAAVTLDGNVEQNPYSFEDLQLLKDAEDQKMFEAAKAQREQMEQQRKQDENANTQNSPLSVEDNLNYADIINNDGQVELVDVVDKNGNTTINKGETAFLVQSQGKNAKVVVLDAQGNLTPRLVKQSLVKSMGTMSLDEYKQIRQVELAEQAQANGIQTTELEDNSGESETVNNTEQADEGETADVAEKQDETGEEKETPIFEDGTPVPVDEEGIPDPNQMTAKQAAEYYDNAFEEDAEQVISDFVTSSKKTLEQAQNMKIKGSSNKEMLASREAKKQAVSDAQAKYDSAMAIAEAYNERMLSKEEGTPEGRRNLIDKARRKFNRMKAKVKDNAEELSKLYSDTVGSLLHRLYDGTGIDVTDTVPLTAEEYVASNLGAHSLNYEGTENSKGVKQETGLSREDFAKTRLLAKDGKGVTIDDMVDKLWNDRPSNLENLDTQDIRNALLDLIMSGRSASEYRNYIQDMRIDQAEKMLEEEKVAAENAAYSASLNSEIDAETFPGKLQEHRQEETLVAPEDATADKPIGEQISQDDVPFSAKDTKEIETAEERAKNVERNRVENVKVVDVHIGKKMRKSLERIAKMMGAKIQWQYTDKIGNGWYDADTNTIYLTLDSSIIEGVQFIFGHEMTHEIKTKNPEAYEELKNLVKEMMGEENFNKLATATQKKYNDAHIYYSEGMPAYEEEVVADQMGHWLQDTNYAHTLAMKMSHPLLAKLHEIVSRIKMAFTGTEYADNAKHVLRTIEQAYVATANREAVNTAVQEGEGGQRLSLRTKPAPKKIQKVYKLMRLGEDGKLYPLFIGSAEAVELGYWYDADSPALKDLKSLSSKDYVGKRTVTIDGEDVQEEYNYGAYIVNNETGEAMSLADFKKQHKGDKRFSRIKNNPNVAALNWATDNGCRWIKIEEKKRGQSRYGGENRSYYNYGINGTGAVGIFAMRPGWHAGSLPTMRQIGKGQGKNLRDDTFVWVEGEIPADIDYNEEAQKNADKDIPDHIPTDGFYLKATNANKEASQADKVGWYVAGAFMPKRIMSDKETREVIDQWNKEHPNDEPVEYDWKRESGKDFNAETMSLEDTPKFSLKIDNQGNPLNEDGSLKLYKVKSIDELTDEDFMKASRNVQLPNLPNNVDKAIGANGKPVIIKKNIFDKNWNAHKFTPAESRKVLNDALYNTDLVGRSQPTKKPNHWVAIKLDEKSPITVLEVNDNKDNVEVVGWYTLDERNLGRIKRQAERNGGELIMLSPNDKVESLSTPSLNSAAKIDNSSESSKENAEKFSLKDKEYLKAVEDGDMDKAQKMVNEAAEAVGYSTDSSYQGTSAFNGSAPWGNGYFLTKEERKEAWDNGEFDGESTLGDYINDDIDGGNLEVLTNAASYRAADPMRKEAINNVRKAIQDKSKTITMYRSVPANVKEGSFRNGDWITPSRSYAVDNAQLHGWGNDYNIIEQEVPVDDVWFDGNDIAEWGYGREEDYINDTDFAYKNTKNNRKQLDAVTYDDNGNVIPLSQRFNPNNADTRYSLKEVNNKFNDRLEELIKNPNQKDKILRLGHASTFLQDGGIADADIELEFDKLKRKAKQGYAHEHPFDLTDVKDLPLAIANPISVFDNTNGRNDGQVILTELKKGDRHFIVAIQTEDQHRKSGIILQVNKIATLFPKDAKGIVNWFIQGKATNVDKEKALHYIEALQNHPGTTISSEELETAAKVIKDYESSKENREKFSLKDEKTLVGVHNITEDKLRKALKLGGFANPSVAIIDTGKSAHNSFGEISFIAPSALVDKKTGGTAGTWTTDAYTQRYPSVERQMSDKGYRKFVDWVDSLDFTDSEKAEIKRQAKDALESNREPAWELMYLREKGIDIKGYDSKVDYSWQNIVEAHPSAEDILESMKSDPKLNEDVTKLAKSEIINPVWRNISQEVRAQVSEEEGRVVPILSPKVRAKVKEIFERDYAPKLLNKDGSPKKSDVKKVVSQIVQQYEDTKTFSFQKSKVKASSYVHNNGLYTDYLRWQENKLDEYGTKNRLFRGYKNDGTRKYIPETLENVSKAMKSDADGQTNGSEYTSFGSFIAKVADRVDSTDEMRANKDKLATNEDKQNFYEKWEEVYYDLAKSLYNDVFAGEERLHDIVTKSDPKKYAKKEYGITLTAGFMKKLDAIKKAVRDELKSNYFETKFVRPVRLNEFAAAVVPNNLGADVRKGLEKAGLPLYDYDANKEGDRQRAFNEAVNSSDNIRFSLAGVRGAANMDKAEEVTTRLDNLSVARQMEEAKKDAKAIKMATGWERGADGKWRYEMPDAKMKDTIDIGGGHIVKRSEDDILWTGGKLGKYVDAPDLFKAYPQLKDVRLDTDEIVNDMPDNGAYDPNTNTITIHATEVKFLNSILNHEIQHAIQYIEGFAKGGSPESVRSQIQEIIDNEQDASDYAKQQLKRYATLQMQAARLDAYKTFVKSDQQYFKDKAQEYYWDAMNELDNDENSKLVNEYPDDKTAKEIAESGYHVDEAIKELKRLGEKYKKEIPKGNMDALEKVNKLTSALKDKSDYKLYQSLAGEVEARNVQKRMSMTDEERRNSLASETEDVAREDQIFLGVDNNDIRYSLKNAKEDRIQKLRESKPVEITGKEITPSDDLKQYKKNALEFGKTLRGTYTNEDTGEVIDLTGGNKRGGIREILQHDYKDIEHLQSIAAIPQIIQKSVFIDELPNEDKQHYPDVKSFRYYVCGLKIDSKDYTVKAVVAEQNNGNRYYDHRLTDIEKGKLLSIIPTIQKAGIDGNLPNSAYKDKRLISILQTNRQESAEKSPSEQKYSLRVDRYQSELAEWKKANNLPKNAERPSVPVRETGESAADFMNRVKQYRNDMALWKTAPQYEDHLLSDDTAQGQFNTELQRGSVLARIALQDSMLAIRKAQEAIIHEVGVDKLNIAEDAYTAENRSHGKGKNEFEEYNDEFLQPLRKSYNKMMKNLGKSYDNVKIYMMAKHGLERNAHIAFKKSLDADYEKPKDRIAAYNAYKGDMDRMSNNTDFENGRIDFTTWRQRDNAIRTKYAPSFMDYRYDKMGIAMDYSGLSALFEGSDFEEAAADMVKDVESKFKMDADDLWYNTNAATKKILRDSYKAGMMSKEVYEYVRGMYQHYIPLRGWGDTNADQVWNYMGGGKGAFSQTLKKANGRGSLADDPIAYIENMAESGILLNNKNWVKQHLLLLAENHPTSLLNVSKAWYIKTVDAQGNEEWTPASPNITANMNSQQVEAELEAFQKRMEKLKQKGEATQKREHLEISYPQTNSEEREHEVRVMKDGEEYVIYVNGDPQLAQAMNNTRAHRVREGLENSISQKAIAKLGRYMAAAYTSMSPLFIPSNYFRDFTMTLASTAIREDFKYNRLLRKNMRTHWKTLPLVLSYQNGTLREKVRNGNASKVEQMFYDYMMNGGETGFVSSMDVEALKKKLKNELKDMNRMALNPKKVGHVIMDSIETLNRAIEGSNRFMIYMTSIQYGRSIEEAVNNAKDVTLNFNRKGTGEHGWQTVRNLYLFINPAIQSLQTLGALAKHHPYKFTAVTTAWMASGVLVPVINGLLMDLLGGDDDKDKYWSFTKWDRRNNFIMWVPFTHNFVKIPLAQEFRGFYGIGDMIASKLMGGEKAEQSWEDYGTDLMGQVIDMMPLDPTGYDGNVVVSLMPNPVRPMFELAFNVDFTGKPLFKDSEYNKYDPNFTKAYVGTPDWLVRISKMVNSIGNDYPDFQQNAIDKFGDPRYNLNNPAVVDHIMSSYLGGAYTMGSQILGLVTKALNGDQIKMADVPLASKFVGNPDDRPASKKQGDNFWITKERHDRTANTLSKLKKKAKVDGDYSTLDVFFGSAEYKQYKQDEVTVKKYEEEKKAEAAKETGDDSYQPKKLTADAVYQSHTTPKDDFEDMKVAQMYPKVNGLKKSWEGLLDMASPQADSFYEKNGFAIEAAEEVADIRKQINDIKKDFLTDGKESYDADGMREIRRLRKEALAILEKANKVIVERQKVKAQKAK